MCRLAFVPEQKYILISYHLRIAFIKKKKEAASGEATFP